MQARAVAAIRHHDEGYEAKHGPGAVRPAVIHGDVLKTILAEALGMHLDVFQRINVSPASLSIVLYGTNRPTVYATKTDAGDMSWLAKDTHASDAPVGCGAGQETPQSAEA